MTWAVRYHVEVQDDLISLGAPGAARVMEAIDSRIHKGEPDKIGKPLRGELAGCRRMRVGDTRIVYRVDSRRREVFVLAVGPRRRDEAYKRAERRHPG
jgi:mRNA interferase RelE/StbE